MPVFDAVVEYKKRGTDLIVIMEKNMAQGHQEIGQLKEQNYSELKWF